MPFNRFIGTCRSIMRGSSTDGRNVKGRNGQMADMDKWPTYRKKANMEQSQKYRLRQKSVKDKRPTDHKSANQKVHSRQKADTNKRP